MKKGQDPATLFEQQLSRIENQYTAPGKKIDEGDITSDIFDHSVLTAEQILKGDALTLSDLETAMNQHWH